MNLSRGAGFPACGFTGLSSPVFPRRVKIRFTVPMYIQFWRSPLPMNRPRFMGTVSRSERNKGFSKDLVAQASRVRVHRASRSVSELAARRCQNPQPRTAALRWRWFMVLVCIRFWSSPLPINRKREVCVKRARPHPNPLPQGEGDGAPASRPKEGAVLALVPGFRAGIIRWTFPSGLQTDLI